MAFAPTIAKGFQTAGKIWDNGGKHALFGFMAIDSYLDYRKEGRGRLNAAGHAALDFVLPELMGMGAYIGFQAASAAPGLLINGAQTIAQTGRQYERGIQDQSPFRTNTFVDSQQIYTMRQAGMALAEQSKYALQQSLMGDEARFMHR